METIPPKLLLIDDHPIIHQGIAALLQSYLPETSFFATFSTVQAIEKYNIKQFTHLILDIQIDNENWIESMGKLLKLNPSIKILIFTSHSELDYGVEAMRNGAVGFLSKSSNSNNLLGSIVQFLQKGSFISENLTNMLIEQVKKPSETNKLQLLSHREREIANLLAHGKRNKEIAVSLDLNTNTVSTLKYRIFEKLNIQNTIELWKILYPNN